MTTVTARPFFKTGFCLLATYYVLALGAMLLSTQSSIVATWWFADAAAIAMLNRAKGVQWALLLLVVGLGNAVANLTMGRPLELVLSFLPGNLLEVGLASFFLQRLCSTKAFLLNPLEIIRTLCLAGVVPILLGSAVGAGVLSAHGIAPFGQVWFTWFEGAGIGALATLPLGIYLLEGGGDRLAQKMRKPVFAISVPLVLLGIWLALTRLPFPWIYVSGLLVLMTLINRWDGAALGVFLTTVAIAATAAAGELPQTIAAQVALDFSLFLPLAVALLIPILLASVLEKLEDQKKEIASNQQELKDLYEKTPAMLHSLDKEGALRFVSDRWLERMGYARGEVIGRKVFEFMAPEDARLAQEQQFSHFKRDGFLRNMPLRMQDCNGDSFEVEVSAVLFGEGADHAPRALSVLNEVTERNAVRKRLEQQTGLLEDVVDSVSFGLVVYDEKRNLRFHNQSFVDVLKLPAELLKKKDFSFSDLVAHLYARGDYGFQHSLQEVERRFVGAMRGWERLSLERQQADGSYIELQAIPLPTGWTVMTYLDITARKSEQRSLVDSKERMQLATESSGVGLWEIDLTTGALQWDAQQYRIYGLEPREETLDYAFWTSRVHPDDLALTEANFQESVLHRKVFESRFRIHLPNGDVRFVMARGRSRLNRDGDVVYMVGTNRDVTAEETYAESLMQARNVARDAAIAKSLFLANMSHELRTPMNAVLGLIQLLGNTALTSNQFDYVEKIDSSAKSLLGLLNDILDFSKIEAGKLDLDIRPFKIDQLMRELAVVLSNYVGTKEIDVLFDIDPEMPSSMLGDPLRLKQVLINLAGNAVKFTQVGQVVISLQLLEQVHDKAANRQQALIEFCVTDSGIGIAPENIPKMFSSFSQAEASTTRKFGGTGLGLSICKLLVELMGGSIALSSELHVGSTFSFQLLLPLIEQPQQVQDTAPDAPVAALTPLAAPVVHAAPHRVLLVDDNPVTCELMAKPMKRFGWMVDIAHSGEAALQMLSDFAVDGGSPYTLAYVDWHLPEMDGWQTIEKMRQWSVRQGVTPPKLIIVSANGRAALDTRPLEEQMRIHDFLVKPVTPSMLYDASLDKQRSGKSLRRAARGNKHVLAGVRILVVEDNAINQQVAEELLNSQGADVSIASDGQLAVNAIAAANTPYDIVLMDIQMPVMDGFEATHIIRQTLGQSSLPIIGLTANAMASDREDCLRAGMNDHLGKPFDLAQLVSTIIRLTGHVAADSAPSADFSVHAAAPVAAIVDYAGALARMGGNERLYLRSAKDLLVILSTARQSLVDALEASNRKQCAMLMHTLKGNAATLGLNHLAALVAEMEVLCKAEHSYASCASHLDELARRIDTARLGLLPVIEQLQSVESEAGVQSNGSSRTAQLSSAFARLAPLLETEDFTALEVFAEERATLELLPGPVLAELEGTLQDLDWGAALEVVRRFATP